LLVISRPVLTECLSFQRITGTISSPTTSLIGAASRRPSAP
jgi:hypothetical protein